MFLENGLLIYDIILNPETVNDGKVLTIPNQFQILKSSLKNASYNFPSKSQYKINKKNSN